MCIFHLSSFLDSMLSYAIISCSLSYYYLLRKEHKQSNYHRRHFENKAVEKKEEWKKKTHGTRRIIIACLTFRFFSSSWRYAHLFIRLISTFNLLHILSFIRTKVVTIGSNFDAILCFRSNHTLLKWITSMANHINQSTEEMTSVPVHHGRFQLQINIYPNSFVEFWAAI